MHRMSTALVVFVMVVGVSQSFAQDADLIAPPKPEAQRETAKADAARKRALRRTPVVEAVEKVRDSVVNISSTSISIVRVSPFGDLAPEFEGMFGGVPQKVKSAGTGFVLHSSGYIVTNAHVVAGTKDVKVTFADDRKSYDARIVAIDEKQDVAILKVNANRPLKAAVLGTSSDLMIGETVIAIGNPFGFEHTVTAGVLSHKGRKINLPNDSGEGRVLLQTDAAINPGNSGGPLLNILGEVIGINTAMRGDAQNIGFAIPIDDLRMLLPGILDVERINRVKLGVHFDGVGPARIVDIDAGSPAEQAGLIVGDVIVAMDGKTINQDIDFFVEMMGRKSGETIDLVVLRSGKRHEVAVRLGSQPSGASQAWSKLGMRLRDLTGEQAARQRGVGLLVYEVHEGGSAYAAGVEPGDILLQIDGKPIKDMVGLARALDEVTSGQLVQLTLQRTEVGRITRIRQFTVNLRAK